MTNAFLPTHTLLPIEDIARKLSLLPEEYETVGRYGAKIRLDLLANAAFPVRGKLIMVTATTPTASGEGKTVVSIGLAQGLERIGQKAILTSREPSLGPVFGMKGERRAADCRRWNPARRSIFTFTAISTPLRRRIICSRHGRHTPVFRKQSRSRSRPDLLAARTGYERPGAAANHRIGWREGRGDHARQRVCHHRGVGDHGHHGTVDGP